MYTTLDIAMQPTVIYTTVDETLAAIAAICEKHHAHAWLFGSRARGCGNRTSDIDIAIECDDFDALEEDIEDMDTVFLIDLLDVRCPHLKEIEDDWVALI